MTDIQEKREVDTDENSKAMNRLQGKLEMVEETIEEIYEMVGEQNEKYDNLMLLMQNLSKNLTNEQTVNDA